MSANEPMTTLSPVKQALMEIRELRARLAALETAASEPLAVVGMALRLPGGVHDEQTLWRVLEEGRDTVGPIPVGRWDVDAHLSDDPDRPGTMWTREGGFLDIDPAGFDAAFFGIAPLEAESMDPQQRLMLELAWHTLEDAGIAPDSLSGSRTGVFIGVGNSDYGRALFGDAERIDAYAGSGGSLAVLAGRVSYVLGLQGPALSIDTACSASLAALHVACASLRSGECDLALVGGINLILSPAAHIAFTKARMMSRDGRCKTFDAAADGYGRGEGAVMLVLQRERDALHSGARRRALVRGSALNQDGRSGGLTAPNGPQQEAVIRAALAQARLAPADIDVVEAHGTGTPLGDPIEMQALANVLGAGRDPAQPLLVGSCKTNFGHLEAAAGLTGLAKVVASLQRRQVPAHLHFHEPSPFIDWAAAPIAVPVQLRAWPHRADGGPARAGVSSFGFSGTNAHVIVEEAMPAADAAAAPIGEHAGPPWHLLVLSARDELALRELARAWRARLGEPDAQASLADLCHTARTGRAQLPQRLAVRGVDAAALQAALDAWLDGRAHAGVAAGRAGSKPPRLGFLFTGQGAQYSGMAAGLYRRIPAVRATLDHCAKVLDGHLDVPLLELLFEPRHASRLADTAYAQPALFAVEVAMAAMWRSFGLAPAVVLGHSLGEYAAACEAGIFPLDDALRSVARRGRLSAELPGEGAMVSVQAGEPALRPLMGAPGEGIEIAAFNGTQQTVLSGSRTAIDALTARLDAAGIRWRSLHISHAFHSAFVEPALAPYGESLQAVPFGSARCAIISNLRGALAAPGEMATPAYWLQQMREPVRFAAGLRSLLAEGVTHAVEVGPHPVLLGLAAEDAADAPVAWLPTLRRDDAGDADLAETLQRLWVDGLRIDWSALDGHAMRRRVAAPLMPFQHRRYWLSGWRDGGRSSGAAVADGTHVWQRLGAALTRLADQAPIGTDVTGYAERWAVLERLTVAHAADVLREAGLFARGGEVHTVDSVRERLGAKQSYAHLLQRWLERLAARGELRQETDGEGRPCFVSDRPLADPRLPECEDAARAALAGDPQQLAYLLHCGRLLPAVIRGRESPLETLFPGGSFELAEGIYQRSTPMRYVNALAAGALESLVAARGAAPLRMLEIGAGTGSTTSALMPVLRSLPPGRVSYLYTDVTPVFFELARSKFADLSFLRLAEFDLERDAASQGVQPGSLDVVIAANAVHATRDLRAALKSLRSLLAPGGVLLLVESTEHLAWYDMTTGLIEGWQHFADDLRTDNPLLPSAVWQGALADAGFDASGAWPPPEHEAARMGQQLICAWVAGSAAATAHDAVDTPSMGMDAAGGLPTADAAPVANDLLPRLADATPDERIDLLRDALREVVRAVLRLDEPPGRHDRLMDLGMDSLMAVQLRTRIARLLALARPLPATLMFDHPTVEALTAYVLPLLFATDPAPLPEAHRPADVPAAAAAPIGAERVAEMSDEEIERLLLDKLGRHP